jgi:aspartyl aminopeptidase
MVPAPTTRLLEFIDAAPTPFHAVAEVARQLEARGFRRLREEETWRISASGRCYVTRNGASIVAFVAGEGAPAETGVRLIGGHTDSPNLRLKPNAEHVREGYRQLGVEVYGGVLLHTWLDRDLALAGRVFVRGEPEPRLLTIGRPIARVPNLAIHLNREVNEKGLVLNRQTHLPPIVGLESDPAEPGWLGRLVGEALGCDPTAIESFDLMLHDAQRASVGGAREDMIFAPRLDNLGSCHASLEALLAATEAGTCPALRGIALFDNEEVGSESGHGAASPLLAAVLERVVAARGGGRDELLRALSRSLFVSADMAHAVHPAFTDRHEPQHMPKLNQGPVVKVNSSMRYATDAATQVRFERACREADVPFQRFVSRTDLACGTTIGPITAARLGLPVVDVGNPMLSMHSIREMAGARDHELMIRALTRVLG